MCSDAPHIFYGLMPEAQEAVDGRWKQEDGRRKKEAGRREHGGEDEGELCVHMSHAFNAPHWMHHLKLTVVLKLVPHLQYVFMC